jgi:hypothetical protein
VSEGEQKLQQQRGDESEQAEILVGTHAREELLGLPDDVESPQPKRTIMKPSPPDEEHD